LRRFVTNEVELWRSPPIPIIRGEFVFVLANLLHILGECNVGLHVADPYRW